VGTSDGLGVFGKHCGDVEGQCLGVAHWDGQWVRWEEPHRESNSMAARQVLWSSACCGWKKEGKMPGGKMTWESRGAWEQLVGWQHQAHLQTRNDNQPKGPRLPRWSMVKGRTRQQGGAVHQESVGGMGHHQFTPRTFLVDPKWVESKGVGKIRRCWRITGTSGAV